MSLIERFAALPRGGVGPDVRVREGTLRDYDALARWHYRGGRPATVVKVLVAEGPHGHMRTLAHRHIGTKPPGDGCVDVPMCAWEHVLGVLIVSMPTLNGRWRELAWPGRFGGGDRRACARRLNAEVRTISRVIVEPRWRGLGIATRLVREYLRSPLTEKTEAVAAMGACCPFFARAGMREWRLGPDGRGSRLIAALAAEGMEAWELIDAPRVSQQLERELRRWADGSRATRKLARGPVRELCRIAAGVGELVAFTAGERAVEQQMLQRIRREESCACRIRGTGS